MADTRLSYDTRNFSDSERERLAWKARNRDDIPLPRFKHWNYDLCRLHRGGWDEAYVDDNGVDQVRRVFDRPKDGCRECGIHFRKHQRVSIFWLYMKKRALLADTMGSGKTTSAGGLIAMLLETGELPERGRVIITPRAPALYQWRAELLRMMPGLQIEVASGPLVKRQEQYLSDWHVLLIGPEMLRNDLDMLERLAGPGGPGISLFMTDDVDALRNDTDTSYACDRLGRMADRYVIMTGTPLQKRLPELHRILDGIGGSDSRRLGTMGQFEQRYCRFDYVTEVNERTRRESRKKKLVGYKNMRDFNTRIAPLYLRRTAADLTDVNLPTIVPDDVFLELYPRQKAEYRQLRAGVVRLIKEEGAKTKRVTALTKIHYGAAICAGLQTLGQQDGAGQSIKLDTIQQWVDDGGDLEDEKIVVFAGMKPTVRALQDRLRRMNIGFETIWGEEKNREKRFESQERFWKDDKCRVIIGTTAMEQSLNLQVSRHLINIDTILNPARMEQLAGRIRRDGSAYQHVFVHNLRAIDTQEMGYNDLLEREAALAGFVWGDNSQLFKALPPMALLQLIAG